MGWKAAIVIGKSSAAWIPSRQTLRFDANAVRTLATDAGLHKITTLREDTLAYGIYPSRSDEIALAIANDPSNESLAAIGDVRAGGEMVGWHTTHPYVQAMVRRYPAGVVVALELQSVSGYWGFAVYERGQPLRAYTGSGDEGVLVDEGAPLPEESAAVIDGEFRGEDCVFEISKRIFGDAICDLPLEQWPCVILKRAKPWWKFW